MQRHRADEGGAKRQPPSSSGSKPSKPSGRSFGATMVGGLMGQMGQGRGLNGASMAAALRSPRKVLMVVLVVLGLRAMIIVHTALPSDVEGAAALTDEERAARRWAEHEERQRAREEARAKVAKDKAEKKEAVERWAYQERRNKRMLIKAKQKEEVTRTEHWDSVEGKALAAAKKRAKAAAGEGGGGGDGAEGGEENDGDVSEEDADDDLRGGGGQRYETFNFTNGVGGEFRAATWSDAAPRACDTWSDGPYKHMGGANATIHKAVWIQTHGNATAAQHKIALEMRANGVRQGAAFRKLGRTERYHHMPALAHLPSGWIIAVWQAAPEIEGEDRQHVRMATSRDGKRWSESWQLPVPKNGAQWSPIPHVDAGGRLNLMYAESEGDCVRPTTPRPKWPPGGSIKMTYTEDHLPNATTVRKSRACARSSRARRHSLSPRGARSRSSRVTRRRRTVRLRGVNADASETARRPRRIFDGALCPYASVWATPKTIYSIHEDRFIPKMLANKLIVLSTGEWVLPFWRENAVLGMTEWPKALAHCRIKNNRFGQPWSNRADPSAGLLVSADGGATWEARGALENAPVPGQGDGWSVGQKTTWLIENSVVELRDGRLLMFFRTSTGFAYSATSDDKGETWTEPESTGIDTPDSKTQLLQLMGKQHAKGPLLLAYNAHKRTTMTGPDGEEKKLPPKCITLLSLSISEDEGQTWRKLAALRGSTAPGLRFHYPWVLQLGCKLVVAYSKFYVTGFKHTENDRELGIRLVHVHI